MKQSQVLKKVEKLMTSSSEREYFLIHSVRYSHILEEINHWAHGKKLIILDIGCYPYHIGQALEDLGHTVYGISSYHEPVKRTNVSVLNIESEKFPYKENFFDMVLCNEVLEHLPHSPIEAFGEILRVTKRGGICMVTTPNIARSINRAKLMLGKSIMYPISVYFENGGKGNNIFHRHNREYILSELIELFEKTKWHIIQKKYFISYTPNRERIHPDTFFVKLGKYVNYCLMKSIPQLSDTLMVIGRK